MTETADEKRNRPAARRSPAGDVPLVLILLLALGGIGVSIELSRVHYFTHTDPSYESVCEVSDKVNCATVARSRYSVFLGAPVSAWGIFGYAFIAAFAIWGLSGRLHPHWPYGVLIGLTGAAVTASSLLAYISVTRIDSICIFCMTLYGINLVLLIVMAGWAVAARLNPVKAVIADARAAFPAPAIIVPLLLITAVSATAIAVAIPPYWVHSGWAEVPELPTGVDENGHHWIGAKDALVTIIEFSDYQCPHCRRAHKETRLLAAKYPDTVRLVHRHLPLDKTCNKDIKQVFHARACEFSKAAECAAEQDAFWKMNDALFSIQESIAAADVVLEDLAVEIGLDRSRFNACMAAPKMPKKVLEDMATSRNLDVRGTPTFFVGPQDFAGYVPEIVIENAIERARKAKQ